MDNILPQAMFRFADVEAKFHVSLGLGKTWTLLSVQIAVSGEKP